MNISKTSLSALLLSGILLLQACVGTPINIGVTSVDDVALYDMDKPKKKTVSASGFQLLLFIPIAINSRHHRAYAAIEAAAGDGLIGDVKVTESWSYGFVGTVYKTTIEANIYPRK